nr:uncharacterized protein LOC129264621 [Lytechinus pictus]
MDTHNANNIHGKAATDGHINGGLHQSRNGVSKAEVSQSAKTSPSKGKCNMAIGGAKSTNNHQRYIKNMLLIQLKSRKVVRSDEDLISSDAVFKPIPEAFLILSDEKNVDGLNMAIAVILAVIALIQILISFVAAVGSSNVMCSKENHEILVEECLSDDDDGEPPPPNAGLPQIRRAARRK